MIEGFLANIQQLLNRIGKNTDPASATGSLHAKVANVQNSVDALPTSPIKSVQRGTTATSSTNPTNVTISPVNMGKSLVNLLSDYSDNTSSGGSFHENIRILLSSSDHLSIITAYSCTISWEVIEFE